MDAPVPESKFLPDKASQATHRRGARRGPRASVVLFALSAILLAGGMVLSGGGGVASADPTPNDWLRLRVCESGNNYSINTGNNYYGAYQFDLGTWQSVGGTGYPHQASPAEQDARALQLWRQRGWSPWLCASILGLSTPVPTGNLESASASGLVASVGGWAYDPGFPSRSIDVHVYVNGVGVATSANLARPDVNAAFGITGGHGFSMQVGIRPGANQICAFAIGVDWPNNYSMGCRTVQGEPPPIGNFEGASANGLVGSVSGWAIDPTYPARSIDMHVYVNGAGSRIVTDRGRTDVNAAYGIGGNHGFAYDVQLREGPNEVCVYAIGVTWPNNTGLGCRVLQGVVKIPPRGNWDALSASGLVATLGGWAYDTKYPDNALDVHIYVNGVGAATRTTVARPDVNAAFGIGGTHGFLTQIGLRAGANEICVYAIGVEWPNNTSMGCRTIGGVAAVMQLQQQAQVEADGVVEAAEIPTPAQVPPAQVPPAPTPPTQTPAPGSSSAAPAATAGAVPESDGSATTAPATSADAPAPAAPAPATSVATKPAAPATAVGAIESIVRDGDRWVATGWAFDPRAAADSVSVAIAVDGVIEQAAADQPRADVNEAQGIEGAHGLVQRLTLSPGTREVCLYETTEDRQIVTAPIACSTVDVLA